MRTDLDTATINRRQFLIRSAKAGACAGIACATGFRFHTNRVSASGPVQIEPNYLPDFSITGRPHRMCIAKGQDRAKTVEKALSALGGMTAFIEKGDRVMLKVNAAFASPPLLSATTHPDLVAAVAKMCFDAGAAAVLVTDNPINDPASCFALTGIERSARETGARIMMPRGDRFKPVSVPGGKLIRNWPVLFEPLTQVNKLIGMAPVKDHHRSGASLTMKNWYGLLGGRRNMFHQDIHNIIKELAVMVRPSLVILDGITTMMHNGPTGGSLSDLKQTHMLAISTDQVAADAFGAELLGKPLQTLAHIKKAEAAGAGTSDWRSLNPVMV